MTLGVFDYPNLIYYLTQNLYDLLLHRHQAMLCYGNLIGYCHGSDYAMNFVHESNCLFSDECFVR